MKPAEIKRATVESAKNDEKQAYEKIAAILENLLSTSTTKTFTNKTLEDASAITLKAAANQSSFHAARKKMQRGTSRRQAAKTLESLDLKQFLKNANKYLQKQARKIFSGKTITISMDLHEIPYHGQAFKEANEVRGGKQKDGTRRFHAFATAYANVNRKRFTLAVVFVENHTPMHAIIKELLQLVSLAGISIEKLLLDKGFYSVSVIRLLKRLNIPFIMPLKGKRLPKKKGSYETTYVVKTVKNGVREELVDACSVIKYDAGKRFKKHGARQLQYISWRIDLPPKKVAEVYRKRFGIESSYKLSKKMRPRTSSRNPAYRAFLFAASFFIQNAWVDFKRVFCWRVPKWSPRFVTLRDFADSLLAVIRVVYGEAVSLASFCRIG